MDLEVESFKDLELIVRAAKSAAVIPSYLGLRLPLTTHLADRVREMMVDRAGWNRFPDDVREWLEVQDWRSQLPGSGEPAGRKLPAWRAALHRVLYLRGVEREPGAGDADYQAHGGARPAARRVCVERLHARSVGPEAVADPAPLLSPDILTHEFVDWVTESHLLRRAFREVAVIAGLVERQHPGKRKTGKQVTFSTDLIYDVLRKYEPDHLLIEAAWADARARMTDVGRLGDLLDTAAERLVHVELERVSPLAVRSW
jgi:ATP-dependent Lhr-like helicase